MGATGAIMALQVGQGYVAGETAKAEGDFQNHMAKLNAGLLDQQASFAVNRGAEAANDLHRKAKKTSAYQRAALAAQGVDVNSAGGADILAESQAVTEMDQETLKMNAYREAWGYKSEANNALSRGRIAAIAGQGERTRSLISGVSSAAQTGLSAYKRNETKGSTGGYSASKTPYSGRQPRISDRGD
jgi:hypothetical protein